MKRPTFSLIISSLFALALPVAAQNCIIRGKVRAPSGATLTNIIVELWKSGAKLAQTVTTSDGDFAFSGLAPATYEIVVQHDGYQPASERAEFYFERNAAITEAISLEIRLKPIAGAVRASPSTTFAQEVPSAARLAFEQALAKLKEGRSSEGLAKLKEAVAIFPDYFNAQLTLAAELSRQNQTLAALEALEHARRVNDRDARVYRLFGELMARQQKFVVAEFAFREAVQRDATHAPSHLSHAVTLIELALRDSDPQRRREQLDEAERELNRALELSDRKLAAAYFQLGRLHEQRGDRKAAASALETYLKLQPDDKNAPAIREAIAKLSQP